MNEINELEHEANKLAFKNILLQIEVSKLTAENTLLKGDLSRRLDQVEDLEHKLVKLQEQYKFAVLEWDKLIGMHHAKAREIGRLEHKAEKLEAELMIAEGAADRFEHALNAVNQALYNVVK